MIIDPRTTDPVTWMDRMTVELAFEGVPPMIVSAEGEWREWARNVVRTPQVSRFAPPSPDDFESFQEWADGFNLSVAGVLL